MALGKHCRIKNNPKKTSWDKKNFCVRLLVGWGKESTKIIAGVKQTSERVVGVKITFKMFQFSKN